MRIFIVYTLQQCKCKTQDWLSEIGRLACQKKRNDLRIRGRWTHFDLEAVCGLEAKKLNISETVGRRPKIRPLFKLNYMAFNIIKWSYFFDSRLFVASRPKKLNISETVGRSTKIRPLF